MRKRLVPLLALCLLLAACAPEPAGPAELDLDYIAGALTDSEAAGRLETALAVYAGDQRSAYEFYAPEQAARMDDPVLLRQGNYLLFAVGEDRDALARLCEKLMNGEGS